MEINAGPDDHPGPIFVIGGSEDRTGDRTILRAVADELRGRKLVLVTVASRDPEGYLDLYRRAFHDFGVTDVVELYIDHRAESSDPDKVAMLVGAGGMFLSGGDQLRVSSLLADTPVQKAMRELWLAGGVLAGTSAGASALSYVMLTGGPGTTSNRPSDLSLAPGLGVLRNVIIDQHFAERGRFGRIIGAVAMSPRVLGIGIDEDTAMVVRRGEFTVIGSGAVYVFDGSGMTWSSVADDRNRVLTVHDMRLHVLADGDVFNVHEKRPIPEGEQR